MFHNSVLHLNISINSIIAFLGGCVGGFTHYLQAHTATVLMNSPELVDFALRSLIGGVIPLVLKLAFDWLIEKYKNRKKKKEGE